MAWHTEALQLSLLSPSMLERFRHGLELWELKNLQTFDADWSCETCLHLTEALKWLAAFALGRPSLHTMQSRLRFFEFTPRWAAQLAK